MRRGVLFSAVLVALIILNGCASLQEKGPGELREAGRLKLCLLPLDNLSGSRRAIFTVMPLMREKLAAKGYTLVAEKALDEFLRRNRIRQTGMPSAKVVKRLGQEFGCAAVLVGSVDLFELGTKPQVGVSLRLVSVRDASMLWAESVSLTGEDFLGPLGLGEIKSIEKLSSRVLDGPLASLPSIKEAGFALGGKEGLSLRPGAHPTYQYKKKGLKMRRVDSLAVLPFVNRSAVRGAGIIASNIFTARLFQTGRLKVARPGEVREALSRLKVASLANLAISDLQALGQLLGVKAVLVGTVDAHERGSPASRQAPVAELYSQVVEVASGETVWTSWHSRKGDDSVIVFDFGRVRSPVKVMDKAIKDMVASLAQ